MKIYTTTEAAKIAGVNPATLDYWVRTNLLTPSINIAQGSGTRRMFNIEDLIQIRFICRLRDNEWSLQRVRSAVTTLKSIMAHPNPLQHAVIIGDKKTILALAKTTEGERIIIDALSAGGQQVMSIVLETLELEVQDVVEKHHEVDQEG